MYVIDPRLEEVQKLVEALISKSMFEVTHCLLSSDNKLVLSVDNTLLYIVPLKMHFDIYLPPIGFSYLNFMNAISSKENINFGSDSLDIHDFFITENLSRSYTEYGYATMNSQMLAYDNDLKGNESYANYMNIKADDGMKYYRLPYVNDPGRHVMIPIFSGFPNITSQDKLGVSVYYLNDRHSLVNFIIHKKKIAREIVIGFRILNL